MKTVFYENQSITADSREARTLTPSADKAYRPDEAEKNIYK